MFRLIDRYVLADLLRTMTLTTGVLVTVIAFGATIKPLASGMLAPTDVAKYVVLAIVPMLQFALPFAAGFAATIVLHRLTIDNEVLACAVSGVSYRRFLVPVLGLGVAIMLFMLLLVHFVIPHFWVLMQKTAAKDVTRMFQAAIANKEPFNLGDLQIYADDLVIDRDPQVLEAAIGSDALGLPKPRTRLILTGVTAAELDGEGEIVTHVTAAGAIADLYDIEGQSFLKLALTETWIYRSADNSLARAPRMAPRRAIPLPDNFRDNPKLMSLPRLLEMREQPGRYYKVIEAKFDLARAIRDHDVWQELKRRVARSGLIVGLLDRDDETLRYELEAGRLEGGVLKSAGPGPLVVREYPASHAEPRRIQCAQADLSLRQTEGDEIVIHIVLRQCRITDPQDGAAPSVALSQIALNGLRVADFGESDLASLSIDELLDRAAVIERDHYVRKSIDDLKREMLDLRYETGARIWHRTALSTTGFLLLILGAVLAMKMRDSLPLWIYLLAFLPSIAAILLLSGGEQMYRDHQAVGGLIVMWSGNAGLALLALVTFWRLSRN